MKEKIIFSRHACDRFVERFRTLIPPGVNVGKAIADRIYRAKENKSFINNHSLMFHLYEKHGYDVPLRVLEDDQVLFICRENVLVTVFNNSTGSSLSLKSSSKRYRKM